MTQLIHKITTWLVLAIGSIHTVGTFFFFESLSESAIWFAGAGLGGLFVAFLNMTLWSSSLPLLQRRLIDLSNVLFVFWLIAGVIAMSGFPPKAIAATGTIMAFSGLLAPRRQVPNRDSDDA